MMLRIATIYKNQHWSNIETYTSVFKHWNCRFLTDFVCLYIYELWLSLCKIVRSSVILLLPLIYIYLCFLFVICYLLFVDSNRWHIPCNSILLLAYAQMRMAIFKHWNWNRIRGSSYIFLWKNSSIELRGSCNLLLSTNNMNNCMLIDKDLYFVI
jgi:hypothetical protein